MNKLQEEKWCKIQAGSVSPFYSCSLITKYRSSNTFLLPVGDHQPHQRCAVTCFRAAANHTGCNRGLASHGATISSRDNDTSVPTTRAARLAAGRQRPMELISRQPFDDFSICLIRQRIWHPHKLRILFCFYALPSGIPHP